MVVAVFFVCISMVLLGTSFFVPLLLAAIVILFISWFARSFLEQRSKKLYSEQLKEKIDNEVMYIFDLMGAQSKKNKYPALYKMRKEQSKIFVKTIAEGAKYYVDAYGALETEKILGMCNMNIEEKIFLKETPVNRQNEVESEVNSLTPDQFPILCQQRSANRAWLVEQILSQANFRPKDSVGMMLASLESDLQHISPIPNDQEN